LDACAHLETANVTVVDTDSLAAKSLSAVAEYCSAAERLRHGSMLFGEEELSLRLLTGSLGYGKEEQ
jgi:hypothetical protein